MEEEVSRIEVLFEGAAPGMLEKTVKNHVETHDGVTLVDIVKFLYQSILGTHHILDHMNDEQIETWIREQLESAKSADRPPTEPMFGNSWVRLDLEAFKHEHGNNYRLATRMFINGRNVKKARSNEFLQAIEKLYKLVSDCKIRPVHSSIELRVPADRFFKIYEKKGFPPLHHSASYAKQNRPYLIVPSETPTPIEPQ